MRILADESVDRPIVTRLRQDGHDVKAIAEESPSITDDKVLEMALNNGCFLLTADKDFGDLIYRQRQNHTGVLLIRLFGMDETSKCDLTSKAISDHEQTLLGAFSVLTETSLRIRKTP